MLHEVRVAPVTAGMAAADAVPGVAEAGVDVDVDVDVVTDMVTDTGTDTGTVAVVRPT